MRKQIIYSDSDLLQFVKFLKMYETITPWISQSEWLHVSKLVQSLQASSIAQAEEIISTWQYRVDRLPTGKKMFFRVLLPILEAFLLFVNHCFFLFFFNCCVIFNLHVSLMQSKNNLVLDDKI